jgi:TDG/mug DNA glycosylase family protein
LANKSQQSSPADTVTQVAGSPARRSEKMRGLRDVITAHPRVLFVGINPSLRSAEVGHHFASLGNPFWRLLDAAGLIPLPLSFEEDWRLAEFGLALTNLCPRPSREASELTSAEIAAGKIALLRKIRRLHPAILALVGISIYRQLFPASKSKGPGLKPETIDGARVFVLPNPSGRNAAFPGFEDKVVWYRGLRELMQGNERR